MTSPYTLADFDFTANPNINPATINELATGDWIRRGDPLCLIGDSGTGKSHLLIALGTAAAEQGYRVRYTLATRLVNELVWENPHAFGWYISDVFLPLCYIIHHGSC